MDIQTKYFGRTREKKLVKIIGRRFRCIKDVSLVSLVFDIYK